MRRTLLGTVAALLTGAGVALGQTPTAPSVTPAPAPPALVSVVSEEGPSTGRVLESPVTRPGRFYADAEYLLWFGKGKNLPPLVTRGPIGDPVATTILGASGTVTLLGDREVDGGTRSGARLRAGFWLDDEQTVGFEASGFYLEALGSRATASSSDGRTILGRPFIDASVRSEPPETALLLSVPGEFNGAASVRTSNRVWGVDALGRFNVVGDTRYRADLLAGFRYLRLAERADVDTVINTVGFGAVPFRGGRFFDASVAASESFRTQNDFYGGHLGTHIAWERGIWFADVRAGLGLGVVHQTLDVQGSTTLTTATARTTAAGGLLAQTTNIGRRSQDEFGIIPEAGLTVGCQITRHVRAFVGYSILYWRDDVLRPDSEMTRRVDRALIPASGPIVAPLGTETRPAPQLREVDFWLQGVHFGVELGF